jgi:hypothetical protein
MTKLDRKFKKIPARDGQDISDNAFRLGIS